MFQDDTIHYESIQERTVRAACRLNYLFTQLSAKMKMSIADYGWNLSSPSIKYYGTCSVVNLRRHKCHKSTRIPRRL